MKRFSFIFIIALLLLTLGTIDTIAQEENNGQLWFCWEATVNPARLNDFIELQVEFRTHFKEANFSYPISAWTDGMFHYFIFYPVKDYNEKDDIYTALWNLQRMRNFAKQPKSLQGC